MELYHTSNGAEKLLQAKADRAKIPLGGTMELLPLCNMDCRMCYIRKTKAEMDAEGTMLTCDQWLAIADQALESGTLFLLLTGGEPLLFPEFKRLYRSLAMKGFILSVNTNGTLIDEEMADFFAAYGCRRLNITLYGKDDDTYAALCRNPRGFTQVMKACRLLKERNVAFRLTCSVTPSNVDQLQELFAIAQELDVPFSPATYMMPGIRRGITAQEQYRLNPEESAAAQLRCYELMNPNVDLSLAFQQELSKLDHPSRHYEGKGFSCHAGHSGFWLNWKGEMQACDMFPEPAVSLLEHSFEECWQYIVDATQAMTFCEDCRDCKMRNICGICPAHCYTECGTHNKKPTYLCRATREKVRLMEEYIAHSGKKETHEQ